VTGQPHDNDHAAGGERTDSHRSHSPVAAALLTTAGAAAALVALTGLGRDVRGIPASIGASRSEILPAATRSPHFTPNGFRNSEPSHVLAGRDAIRLLPALLTRGDRGHPPGAIPLITTVPATEPGELGVTWLGHATALIELDGHYVLADPVWGRRVSPSEIVGPARMHALPIALSDLPALAAIVISHDHYDHLDLPTVRTLLHLQTAPFVVPIGIGAHLRGWGVPDDRIVELDWDEHVTIGDLTLTCAESRHFSGRGLRRNTTLWCSWAMAGPRHRIYFGGDTGYTGAFGGIGRQYGPFDVTILPIGAYSDQWPDIHLNPEEAVAAHHDLGGGLFLPIHWATFDLAMHTWAEPVERLLAAADGMPVAIPRPGERVDVTDAKTPDGWWRQLG